MSNKLVNILFVLLALNGCVSIPKHELADKNASASCSSSLDEALSSGQFIEGGWPNANWREMYKDEHLNTLIQTAIQKNPNLMRTEARLKAAYQGALQKRARLFPEVDLDGDTNWQSFGQNSFFRSLGPAVPPVVNQIDLKLNFSYEFDFWGKNRSLFEAALGQAKAAEAERAQSILILTTSVAYTYFQQQLALIELEILEKLEKNKEQLQTLVEARQLFALDNAIQQLDADRVVLDSQSMVIEAEQEIRLQTHKLKALTGVGQDAGWDSPSMVCSQELELALPKTLSLDLLSRRPDLMAQSWRVQAAAKEIGAAKADFYPNVNLLAFAGLESLKFSTFFERHSSMSAVTPAFHLPIFTAGRLKAQLMEKVAIFNEAVYGYNDLILQAAQEVADTVTIMIKLQELIETQAKTVETIRSKYNLTQQRFEHGIDTVLDLLLAENQLLKEQLTLIELHYSKKLSSIKLIQALGGGYGEPLS